MVRVIGIGDNVCDKYEHLKTMFPGGQALNFSVYAKLLGADASYMGVFGTDEVAVHVIKTLDELGVEHGRCRQYEGENGCARVTLKDGDRIFLGSNKGGVSKEHSFELTEEDLAYISTFSLVHTSNNSYMDSQLEKIHRAGIPISYDFPGSGSTTDASAGLPPMHPMSFCPAAPSQRRRAGKSVTECMQGGAGLLSRPEEAKALWFMTGMIFTASLLIWWRQSTHWERETPLPRPFCFL